MLDYKSIRILISIASFATVLMVGAWAEAGEKKAPSLRLGPEALYPSAGVRSRTVGQAIPPPLEDVIKYANERRRLLAIQPRIIGGTVAPIGAYPWQVSIGMKNVPHLIGHFCGGSIIASRFVLTAAHCVDGQTKPENIQVLAGTNVLGNGGKISAVIRILVHEKWNPSTYENDVALLELKESLNNVPVELITQDNANDLAAVGLIAIVSGWGLTKPSGQISTVLRHVGVEIVSNSSCNGPASYGGAIKGVMMCAGFVEGGKDSCQGDSGGPLMVPNKKGGFVLAGIVSWGEGCAAPTKFGVYTRVSEFAGWVGKKAN